MEEQSFKYQIWRRMEYILQNSSCHGGNWVMKLSNSKIKSAGSFLVFVFQFIIFYVIITKIFVPSGKFSTTLLWDSEPLIFPNMTICNPRLYDKKKVEGDGWKIQIQTLESLLGIPFFFLFSELAFLYWPVSMENELQLSEKVTLLFFQRLIARIYSIQDLMSNY